MPPIRFSIFVLAFLAMANFTAADPISFVPPNPQSGQPFLLKIDSTWRDGCVPVKSSLLVVDKRIFIDFSIPDTVCLPAVGPWTATIAIPPLGSGAYEIIARLVDYGGPVPLFRQGVTVAGPPAGIRGVYGSFDASAGNRVVRIYGSFPCPAQPCVPNVFFGGKLAEAVERVSEAEVDAVAPAQTKDTVVELTVLGPGYSYVLPSGFTYVSVGDYEPFLVPVFTRRPHPGALASSWITELSLVNLTGIYLEPGVDIFSVAPTCINECIPTIIPPNYAFSFSPTMPLVDLDTPPTAMFYIRRIFAPFIAVQLRTRDTSRQQETWGTEIPVVRGSRMGTSITLLDIPVRDGFRQMLRLYMPDYAGCCGVNVRFFSNPGKLLATRTLNLQYPNGSIGGLTPPPYWRDGSRQFPLQPAYAELDLSSVPELAGNDPIWIRADSAAFTRMWGFVSITHDETQHVTTITPQ